MKHLLIPDLICNSVYEIPFSDFYEKGIRALAFDIDNTLVSYDTPEPDERLSAFLFSLRDMGFSVAFISNNVPERVERFNASLGFTALPDSHKPLTGGLTVQGQKRRTVNGRRPAFDRCAVRSACRSLGGDGASDPAGGKSLFPLQA